jgi:adenosine/AMP kinase
MVPFSINPIEATANLASAVGFLYANTQTEAVIGVVDGYTPVGVEGDKDRKERHEFLRRIGYKK